MNRDEIEGRRELRIYSKFSLRMRERKRQLVLGFGIIYAKCPYEANKQIISKNEKSIRKVASTAGAETELDIRSSH